MKIIFNSLVFLLLISCATTKKVELGDKTHNLTESYAMYRSQQIKDVSYNLDFDLSEKKKFYQGVSRISFSVLHKEKDLRVDFNKGEVKGVKLNTKAIQTTYTGSYIRIPKESLTIGPNQLEISFKRDFSKSGRGFHRFQDPVDKRVYVYTNLEPYDANQVFPCFDQPDLKADYEMKVMTPKKWKVITSVRESQVKSEKTMKVWTFPKSARFSTYIWSLHAGDYQVWEEKKFRYPMRLFSRRSLAKYVKPKQWFRYTKASFDYFDKYFGYPYPYKKYDQIIVPEFFSGAMENVASVTFNEGFTSKGEKTRNQKLRLAAVIMHEMAHMWFGNLVTMKWWNDLWLNESFATYMAMKALYASTEFKESWRRFSSRKSWAYWEDELTTTHPIEGIVPDTLQARTNFDGISYGKGGSVLKQVNFLLGEKDFQQGVQSYFKKHAGTNTTLKDFMGALQSATSIDLSAWQKEWLQTAGVNSVRANFTCANGKIDQFSLKQTYKEGFPYERKHKSRVALISEKSGKPQISTQDVIFSGPETKVPKLIGKACPKLVYPNYQDYAYFKVDLDPVSLKNSKLVLGGSDHFLKEMYWNTLWRSVRDAKVSVVLYANLVRDHFDQEKDQLLIQNLGEKASSLLFYLPNKSMEEQKFKAQFISDMESKIWNKLVKSKSRSEIQKILFGVYVGMARTSVAQKNLYNLLTGRKKLAGFKIDQDKRWYLIGSLSRHGYSKAPALIDRELNRDKSAKGEDSALAARVGYPQMATKEKWFKWLSEQNNGSNFNKFRIVSGNLFPAHQLRLKKKFSGRFFNQLTEMEKKMNPHFARAFTQLVPLECEAKASGETEKFLAQNAKLRPGTAKGLKTNITESQRCRNIKMKARKEGLKIAL